MIYVFGIGFATVTRLCLSADTVLQSLAQLVNLPFKHVPRHIPAPVEGAYLDLYEKVGKSESSEWTKQRSVWALNRLFALFTQLKEGQQLQCLLSRSAPRR